VDCRPLVNRQLDSIPLLVSRLKGCNADESKFQLFREICDRAVLHVLSRERVLLPAWRRARWKEFPLASFAAHARFKRALADLLVHPPAADGHAAALEAFSHQVERQRALDGDCLIPRLRSAMDVPQRRELCNDIELLFDADQRSGHPSLHFDASPRELVQEAAVVLSSLARHRHVERGMPARQGGAAPGLGLS